MSSSEGGNKGADVRSTGQHEARSSDGKKRKHGGTAWVCGIAALDCVAHISKIFALEWLLNGFRANLSFLNGIKLV